MSKRLKNEIREFPAIMMELDEKSCDHFVISTFENQFLFMPLQDGQQNELPEQKVDSLIYLNPQKVNSSLKTASR